MPETMEGIRVPIVVNDRGALREVKRGMGFVVADLKKRIKSMDNAGLPTHDLDEALAVWLGNGGDAGVIHQVEEQLDGVVPAAAPAGGDTVDMFDEVPVATGPNPPAERVLVTADELRDRLASGCQVYVPAAVIGRWPREMRAAVQDYEADVRTALEVGGVLPEVPAWLIDYPLPALVHRVGDALFHRSDADAEPERIHDPVEWLEEVAEAEITLREDAALRAAHPGQPWVPVDVGYGEGLERWQVMHRETRERRRVDAGFFAGQAEGDAVDGPEHAASAGPEECVAAYAFHLSTTEPGGPVAEADVAGNVEAGARLLRALLFDSGLVVSLSAILDEWDADQRQAAWEWATSSDGSSTPEHVRLAHWSHDEFTALHPDEDFAAELAAAGWTRDGGDWIAPEPGQNPAASALSVPDVAAAFADADEDIGPAPAHVVSLLEKAGRRVPLHLVMGWPDAEREQVARWAISAKVDRAGWLPEVLRDLAFRPDAENPDVLVVPDAPPRFTLANKRKPVRILDAETNDYYGDDWSMAEAEHVRGRWNAGIAADVRGEVLEVAAQRVRLEPVLGAAATA